MCPKLEDIRMDHIVDYTKNYVTFATARENSNNHLKIFLVNDSGSVYIRNGRAGNWMEILGFAAEKIRLSIDQARGYVPVYKVNTAYAN
jgi:thiamine phosphate synthase YjbQ (UPF0047 family)